MGILSKLKIKKEEKKIEMKEPEAGEKEGIKENPSQLPTRYSGLLIKQAWVTEKANDLSVLGKYAFIVDQKANKSEIKKAIEAIYNIKIIDVNIVNIKGKTKRLGRSLGRTSAFKKAIITLKEGQKIEVMPT